MKWETMQNTYFIIWIIEHLILYKYLKLNVYAKVYDSLVVSVDIYQCFSTHTIVIWYMLANK